jgi:hypothetical protein
MSESNPDRLPEDLLEVAEKLRDGRVAATPLELDELKLRAKAQASGPRSHGLRGGTRLRSRAVTLALTALLVGGTTAGGIAASGGSGGSNAADQQYRPGMGCGDKNHIHTGPPGNPNKNPATDCPKGSAQNP